MWHDLDITYDNHREPLIAWYHFKFPQLLWDWQLNVGLPFLRGKSWGQDMANWIAEPRAATRTYAAAYSIM